MRVYRENKNTSIPSLFFCSPLFHSRLPELRLPTVLCKYFTLSTCRVAETRKAPGALDPAVVPPPRGGVKYVTVTHDKS